MLLIVHQLQNTITPQIIVLEDQFEADSRVSIPR